MSERLCMGCMEKVNDKYEVCPYCGYVDGTPAKEAYHMEPGSILQGRYIVGKVIGYGGFGVTYIGYDPVFECKIAIKEYLPGEFATRCAGTNEVTIFSGEKEEQFVGGIVKFLEEARRLAKFKNTAGIVRINDSFNENNTAYIVMEYLDGETLKEKIEREGKLSLEESLNIIMPILEALKEVHKEGILHRDISPDNIFITKKGEVKLLDFGAARYATTTHSKSLSVIVKPGYAPQEQYRSRGDQGTWTDVYACAATLYKMITGVTPEDSMERGNKDTLVAPSKLGIKLPKNKENAIMNALNLRIEDRTQTAEDFENELSTENSVKLIKVHLKKMDMGRWPLWLKITSGLAAASILVFVGLLATGVIHFDAFGRNNFVLDEGQTYVPYVVNYELAEAESKCDGKMLIQIVDKQISYENPTIPRDKVLSQGIEDGTVVEVGTVLELVISAGRGTVFMPDLEGMSQEEVMALFEEMELNIEIIEEESDMPPGYVFKQELEEGTEVEKGTTVKIYVSIGNDNFDETKKTTVPNVVGKTFEDGKKAMSEAKLYIYKSGQEYSDSIPKGQIISQDVKAGSEVNEGTNIGVVVSLGKETTRVPDVQYKSQEEATGILTNAKLTVSVAYEDSDTVAKGHVIRQSIAAGTEVDAGTTVTIYISNGNPAADTAPVYEPTTENTTSSQDTTLAQDTTQTTESPATTQTTTQSETSEEQTTTEITVTETTTEASTPVVEDTKVSVPNLTGQTETAAVSSLQNVGLGVGEITYKEDDTKTNGTVLSQNPTSGTKVEKGTTVDIVVCKNKEKPKTVTVPNLVGKTESSARTTLTDNKLAVGTVSYQHDESKTDGTVISQGTASGKSVNEGTAVDLVVCNNETYTEYRYKTVTSYDEKTTTTFSAPSGYTYVREETTYGDYGSWSDWSTTQVSESDTRKVETQQVAATYKTQYMYERCYGQGSNGYWYAYPWQTGVCQTWEFTNWLDNPLPNQGNDTFGSTTAPQYGRGYDTNGNFVNPAWGSRWDLYWYSQSERTVEATAAYKKYRYCDRTKTTTYYWQKPVWSDWSSWSTTPVTTDDTTEVETRETYKY